MTILEVLEHMEKLIKQYEQGLSTPDDLRRALRILAARAAK